MRRPLRSKPFLLIAALVGAGCAPLLACGSDDSGSGDDGGSAEDASGGDVTLVDGGHDATTGDANGNDTSVPDANVPDTHVADANGKDATSPDANGSDASSTDAASNDASDASDASDAGPDVYDAGPPCSAQNPCSDAGNLTCCSGSCVDTTRDPRNCGACGNGCTATQFCNGVACNDAIFSNVCANARATVALDPYPADDDAGITVGNALATKCAIPVAFTAEYDSGIQEPGTNRPITGVGNTFVECGGAFGQSSVAYLDGTGLTTIYGTYAAPDVGFFDRDTDAAVVDVPSSTVTAHHDYFLLQLSVEPVSGTLCFSSIGIFAPGTTAASYWFATVVAPSLATYTERWYVVEWTDTDNDSNPTAGDTFTVIAHGH